MAVTRPIAVDRRVGSSNQIDATLASKTKSGYNFTDPTTAGTPATQFSVNADPVSASSGTRHFFVNESGVIRYNQAAAATNTDNALQ